MPIDVDRLPDKVYPITQVNKVNEIVDVLNHNLNMYYSTTNPVLTPVAGVVQWSATHNLGTENVTCTLYEGDNLIISKVSVDSVNAVTVYLNSTSEIPAGTYKITIVTNGGANLSGTSSIQVDSALSTTSENPVQNKVIAGALDSKLNKSAVDIALSPTSENPVRNDVLYHYMFRYFGAVNGVSKVINVKLDGTGDFTTIEAAYESLKGGKWGNELVVIRIGEGTHTLSNRIIIDVFRNNFPSMIIEGVNKNTSIIQNSYDLMYSFFLLSSVAKVWFHDLTFNRVASASSFDFALHNDDNSEIVISNCVFNNFANPIYCESRAFFFETNDFNNFTGNAITSTSGFVATNWSSTINFTNSVSQGTAFAVNAGGQIHINGNNTLNYTRVSNKTNKTVGSANNQGWITGVS